MTPPPATSRPYDTELASLRTMLARDGFGIDPLAAHGTVLDLEVVVTSPAACADCLVPQPLMRHVIDGELAPFGLTAGELVYPKDLPQHAPDA